MPGTALTTGESLCGNETAYCSDDQRSIVGYQEPCSAVFWRPSARHEVESVLTGTVKEVVLQVSHGTLAKVIECALLRARPSPSEIGLEGTSSTVCPGNGIRMLRPDYS